MNWFDESNILVGYTKVSATTDSYSVYGSSLGLVGISNANPRSIVMSSFKDLCDPVCWLPPTDEADQLSCDQKYMTRFIAEWYVVFIRINRNPVLKLQSPTTMKQIFSLKPVH